MSFTPSHHVCIATLGGQPQVVTLALDRLLAQGYPISELLVLHLAPSNPRYQRAIQTLAAEFPYDCYVNSLPHQPCRLRPISIKDASGAPLRDLDQPDVIPTVQQFLSSLLSQYRQSHQTLHLCISGGRRLLGYLLLTLAPTLLRSHDHIWQLTSSDAVRDQTRDGAMLHVPTYAEVQLMELPTLYLTAYTGHVARTNGNQDILKSTNEHFSHATFQLCQQVWHRLNDRQRKVLREELNGTPRRVTVAQIGLSLSTVNEYFTTIYDLCEEAWELDVIPSPKRDWLWEQFHPHLDYL
ncbi:MAG: hypothetical protein HC911_13830 [Chloroflexaceae bacterium]|nr:hypothetical protein [Chloroflexaceae bacterium]